ncbi:MAG: hypothetical protein GX625_05580 [Clostridiaceae bacterium]|nr:hypothetical protein [Clostridiaceae bacterium]
MFEIENLSKDSIIESFDRIGKDLILNRAISVNGYLFSLIDIEFYYHHENHPDGYTMKHIRPKGELEIHRYGIDISLGSQEKEGYGGVLICSLYDRSSDKPIPKPQVIRELYNQIRMGDNKLDLVEVKPLWNGIFQSKRQHLGDPGTDKNKQDYVNSMYKYVVKDEGILRDYKGKEAILRSSDLSEEEIEKLIKYKLKK